MPKRPKFLLAVILLLALLAVETYLARVWAEDDIVRRLLLAAVLFGLVYGPAVWLMVFRPLQTCWSNQENGLKLLSDALTATSNAVFITNRAGDIVWANEAFAKLSGYGLSEIIGRNPRFLQSGQHDRAYYERLWSIILAGETWSHETVERHKSGHHYTVLQTITPIVNDQQQVTHFIAMHDDISDLKETEARMQRMAHHDALTGLSNRILFKDRLKQSLRLANRNKRSLALLYLDLDRFKQVNDDLGHAVGDLLLKSVAKRLRRCVRESDTISRLGGDEFTVILPEIEGVEDAITVAEKIIQVMAKPFSLSGNQIQIGCSIGIALYPRDADNVGELMLLADSAMYLAKMEGRNTYRIHTPEAE